MNQRNLLRLFKIKIFPVKPQEWSQLVQANLDYAQLIGACLVGARFIEADLTQANLTDGNALAAFHKRCYLYSQVEKGMRR